MVYPKKWIVFGYLDVLTSIAQLLVTLTSSLLSIYFHFKNTFRVGKESGIEVAPTINLVFAIFAAYINLGHISAAKKLIKAGKNVRKYLFQHYQKHNLYCPKIFKIKGYHFIKR